MMRLLRPSIAKKRLILFLVDVVIIIAASFLAALIRFGEDAGVIYLQEHLFVFLLSGVTFLVFFYIADLYDFKKDFCSSEQMWKIILSGILAFIVSGFLIYGYRLMMPGRGVFFLYAGMVTLGVILWRYVYTHLAQHPDFKIKAVVIGTGSAQKSLISEIKKERNLGIEMLGFVSTDPLVDADRSGGLLVLGKIEELENIVKKYQIARIIVEDRHRVMDGRLESILTRCLLKGVKVIDIASFYQEHWHRIPLNWTSRKWLYRELAKKEPFFASYERNLKRLVDLIGGGLGFILFLLVLISIAIAIKLSSKGPVFYRQTRLGKEAKVFSLLKFRTMVDNAEEESGAVWAENDDPRITRAGRFLRRMRLDEFPQFLNVLKGEMSLVGPRPEREEFVDQFLGPDGVYQGNSGKNNLEEEIPYYSLKFLVKPGITGWAQIN